MMDKKAFEEAVHNLIDENFYDVDIDSFDEYLENHPEALDEAVMMFRMYDELKKLAPELKKELEKDVSFDEAFEAIKRKDFTGILSILKIVKATVDNAFIIDRETDQPVEDIKTIEKEDISKEVKVPAKYGLKISRFAIGAFVGLASATYGFASDIDVTSTESIKDIKSSIDEYKKSNFGTWESRITDENFYNRRIDHKQKLENRKIDLGNVLTWIPENILSLIDFIASGSDYHLVLTIKKEDLLKDIDKCIENLDKLSDAEKDTLIERVNKYFSHYFVGTKIKYFNP